MSIKLSPLKPELERLMHSCQIRPEWLPQAQRLVHRIQAPEHLKRYQTIALVMNCPWEFVAIIHILESSGDFSTHLHNGDSLQQRTVNAPAGRPRPPSHPPFTWEESAIDALSEKEIDQVKDWSIPGFLFQLEQYNGFGYRLYHPHCLSPYLWSGTNHYVRGKYASDGKFDTYLKSEQVGGAVLLKLLLKSSLQDEYTMSSQSPSSPNALLKIFNPTSSGTYLKQSTAQSLSLHEADKHWVVNHSELQLKSVSEKDNHYWVVLEGISFGGKSSWYVFKKHCSILGDITAPGTTQIPDALSSGIASSKNSPASSSPAQNSLSPLYAIASGEKKGDDISTQEHLAMRTQVNLISCGLLSPPADGRWGPISTRALATFQKLLGISESGLGIQTARALINTNPANLIPGYQLTQNLASQIVKFCIYKGYKLDNEKRHYNLIVIEGMNGDGSLNNNAPDTWSSRRIVLEMVDKVPYIRGNWACTSRPGVIYNQRPINPAGALFLAFGQQPASWKVGIHYGSKSSHEALVQDGEIYFTRDRNKNYVRSDDPVQKGSGQGVNFHHGYDLPTVGYASAGCPAAQSAKKHLYEFMPLMKQDARYQANRNFHWSAILIYAPEMLELFPLR
jgi:lysozyme family protein